MKANLANILTWLRIAAIPLVVYCFFSSMDFARPIAGIVFGLAAVTDWLDGLAARKLGQASRFGEFLDPVADKLMVAVCLVLLVQSDPEIGVALIAMIIIGREITVSALREWMAGLGEREQVKVSVAGKVKTILQMVGIAFMVYQRNLFGIEMYEVGYILLLAAAGMTMWSMIIYLRAAWPSMQKNA